MENLIGVVLLFLSFCHAGGTDGTTVADSIRSRASAKLVKNSTLKVCPGFDHGMCSTHKDGINADLLAFIKG